MIDTAYLYVLIALIYMAKDSRLTMEIFLVSLVMILQIISNVTSVIDLAFACIYGFLALQIRQKGE